jgi:hypothetical protein
MLRPSAYLTFTLEGSDITSSTASAIKRSYTYLAPTKIVAGRREAAENETPLGNRIALDVHLPGSSYWETSGETDWREILLPWLITKLGTLFGTVAECNNETRRSYSGSIQYEALELKLGSHAVRVTLEPTSTLRNVEKPLEAARSYLNRADVDPTHIAGFNVPSDTERGESDWIDVHLLDGTTERVAV